MKKIRVIDDGNLSGWLRTVLCVTGAGIVYWSVQHTHSMLMMSFGLLLAAIGGYASRARMLKIKPFDNSYKKARKSYESKKDDEGARK
ncbi:hypothetical protein KDW55_03495 [Burkholderia sp. AU19243]|uniref:hypothetical protein n=1 Tax=Burkholderia sp. AU19243 TaxID=2824810 RepID=UPI001B9B6F6E|nr:hypothetical protein [Burkholderia sp. AU19243]MBR8144545.1 hypothetical protein [Burkholderia vietnamiensis]MBR8362384.1 hypothetical protein [Burkholderia sp. AU19243]